ncbi:MAG: hypothetical protein NTW21_43105 [Verrucomicrobia bacterium]|nr:hypothetical protein [Verrucomicrobiota bacterium]
MQTAATTPRSLADGSDYSTDGGNIPSSEYGTDKQFVVQTSPDLVNWADVPNDGSDPNLSNNAGAVSYTLPPGAIGGKLFVRLMMTPN